MRELISVKKKEKKHRRGMNGQTLSPNPHQQGKSHHRASSAILCLAVCVRDIMTTAGMCGKSVPHVLRQNGSVLQQYRANQCDFVLKSSNSERKRTSVAFKYSLQMKTENIYTFYPWVFFCVCVCVCVCLFQANLKLYLQSPFPFLTGYVCRPHGKTASTTGYVCRPYSQTASTIRLHL